MSRFGPFAVRTEVPSSVTPGASYSAPTLSASRSERRRSKRIRYAGLIRWILAPCLLAGAELGCSPTRTVLFNPETGGSAGAQGKTQSSGTPPGDDGVASKGSGGGTASPPGLANSTAESEVGVNQKAGGDSANAVASGQACELDTDCPSGTLCRGTCTACTRAVTPCPTGTKEQITVSNGCYVLLCAAVACTRSEDCELGAVCWENTCTECDAAPDGADIPCRAPWERVARERNGCIRYECTPPNECIHDTDCKTGTCYPGAQCESGADGDPKRCRGNRCSSPGCPAPAKANTAARWCADFGCVGGLYCSAPCGPSACWCDTTTNQWICGQGCGVCQTYY